MGKQRIVVEISQSRLEVALVRGRRVVASRCERTSLGMAGSWAEGLKLLAEPLKRLAGELGAQGADATVLYWSPTAVAGVFNCARAAGTARALSAARLALADTAGAALESNPHALVSLAADASRGEGAQVHTLGVFERDSASHAVRELLGAAGLGLEALVPIEAPAVLQTARRALARAGVAASLHVGEHGSVLAGVADGKLKFLRQIALGTESLAAALAREIRPEGGGAVRLDLAAARDLLARVGVPQREQVVLAEQGITGNAVLPLLQPVLQRWLVEIKQSLRFGFQEQERTRGRLVVCGCGAGVARLGEIIAEQCELACDSPDGACAGAIAAWLEGPEPGLNLLPRAVAGERHRSLLTRGMWVGAAAASVVIAADAALTRMEIARVKGESAGLTLRLEAAGPAVKLRDELVAEQSALSGALKRLSMQGPAAMSWPAVLALLSRETPERVRLSDIRLGVENGRALCRISGETPLQGASERLKGMLERLLSAPVVAEGRMGSVQRGESEGGAVQQFEMVLSLAELPRSVGAPGRIANVEAGRE